ncbi:MAG TPA: FHA domain-containing protein [Polyangia bacterium]|nr:FHA domain-containing protein [Polyangia bacterium]
MCSACGTSNPPGMNFCKMCGTSLAAKAPEPAAPAARADAAPSSGKVTCPSCGKQTPAGFSFCQHCGTRLGAPGPATQPSAAPAMSSPSHSAPPAGARESAPSIGSPASAALGVMQTMAAVGPTPPAGLPRAPQQPLASPPARAVNSVNNGDALAATMAPSPAMMPSAPRATADLAARPAQPLARDTIMDAQRPEPEPVRAPPPVGTLVSVNRDGSDGASTPIAGETFDVGRTDGALKFMEDPYLAPRHARLVIQGGKVILRPLDQVNGVYLRIQGSAELQPGDQFLVGKELLRYEPLAPEERDPPSLVEHGVRLFGTVPREAWGRLRQLTVAGTTRDLWHLTRPELVLGREEGDVTFPDDEFMSRRHAALKRAGTRARLEDLNSSNGTFVRVRGDRELKPGDVLRMGDQLLRFEA